MTVDQLIAELQKAQARGSGRHTVVISTASGPYVEVECAVSRLNDMTLEPREALTTGEL